MTGNTEGRRAGMRVVRTAAIAAVLAIAGGVGTARAAANNGGVAYLSWSVSDTMSSLSSMPTGTATLYMRLGLVQEIKGIEYTLHWSNSSGSGCAKLKSIIDAPNEDTNCVWAMRGPAVPITSTPDDTSSSNRLFIARAVPIEQLLHCQSGTVAGVTFNFDGCDPAEGMSFCLESFLVIDGQNVIDSLTVAGDAHIGAGGATRACGPLPPPRIDRVLPGDALFGSHPTLTVSGFNFLSPTRIRLVRAGTDTLAPVSTEYHNASELAATFDLSTVPAGLTSLFGNWSLIVTNPDGRSPASGATFVVKVPAAQIDSIRPSTLFSGPGRGRVTTVRFYGRNYYSNPTAPTVRISNGPLAVIPGANPRLESPGVLAAEFSVPDSLPQLASADIADHAFTVTVQNQAASEATVSRGIYLYRPSPLMLSVRTTAEVGGNRVEWSLDGATSGSRFRVTRQSFRCGILDRTATVFDSVFTRGKSFHYVDAHPPIGRFVVYSVRHVYLLGLSDSVVAEMTSPDSVGTRCIDGGGGGGGGGGGTEDGLVVAGTTFNPPASLARFVVSTTAPMTVVAEVYDLRGRRVKTLADGTVQAGETEFAWDGRRDDGNDAPVGVYVLKLQRGVTVTKHRLVLVR